MEELADQVVKPPTAEGGNTLASLIPWLTSLSASGTSSDTAEAKPARYLVAKGLPTIVVQKVWNLEFVEMEDFLRSLRLAEQRAALQESLVGALIQFQALQQHKAQRRVTDVVTWVRCFSLFMVVLSKKVPGMVPSMVAHLHTVLRLHQRASFHNIQFHMELAGQGLDIRRPVAVYSVPARAEANRGPLRHGGGGDAERAEGKRQAPSTG